MIYTSNKQRSYEIDTNVFKCDVAVIGKDLSAYLTAYTLLKNNENVIIVEDDSNTAHTYSDSKSLITLYEDSTLQDLVSKFGEEKASQIWNSSQKSINELEKIIERENIDCDFERSSSYLYAMDYNDLERLRKEFETAKDLSLSNFKFRTISKIGIGELAYLEVGNQAKVNEKKLLTELKRICQESGVRILETTSNMVIEEGNNEIVVTTPNNKIIADNIINTSYNSINSDYELSGKLLQSKSYYVEAVLDTNHMQDALFYSPEDNCHNFRVEAKEDGDHVIFNYKTNDKNVDEDMIFNELENCLKEIFPKQEYKVLYKWSENIETTCDGAPLIGNSPFYDSELVSAGFGTNRVLHGIESALINRDILFGVNNKLTDIYDPDRAINKFDFINRFLNDAFESIKVRLFGKEVNNEYEDKRDNAIAQSILKYKNIPNFKKSAVEKSLKHF